MVYFFKSSFSYKWDIIAKIIAFLYPLFWIFQGVDFGDSPFNIITIEYDNKANSLFYLTYIFGDIFYSIFGVSWLSSRILFCLFFLIILFVTDRILLAHFQRSGFILFFISVIAISTHYFSYNYDITTLLIYSLILYQFFKSKNGLNYIDTILLGVFCGLSVFLRLPNILLFPLVLFFVILHNFLIGNRKFLKAGGAFLFGFFISIMITYLISYFIYDFDFLSNLLFTLEMSTSSTHSIYNLIIDYLSDLKWILRFTLIFLFCFGLITILDYIFFEKHRFLVTFTCALITLFLILYVIRATDWIYLNAYQFSMIAILSVLLIGSVILTYQNDKHAIIIGCLILLLLYLLPMGSFTGLKKATYCSIVVVPYIVIKLPKINKVYLPGFYYLISFLIISSLLVRFLWIYGDNSMNSRISNICRVQVPRMSYVYTDSENKQYIEGTYNLLKDELNEDVVFLGPASNFYYFLFAKKRLITNRFVLSSQDFVSLANDSIKALNLSIVYFLPPPKNRNIKNMEYIEDQINKLNLDLASLGYDCKIVNKNFLFFEKK